MSPESKIMYVGHASTYVHCTNVVSKQLNSQVSLPGYFGRDCAARYNGNMQCYLHIYHLQTPTIPPHEQHKVECK